MENLKARWLKIDKVWLKVGIVPPYLITRWQQVCLYADTLSGHVLISLNGEPPISFMLSDLNEERPKSLQNKLFIGLSEVASRSGKQQFHGEVANFNIHSVNYVRDI